MKSTLFKILLLFRAGRDLCVSTTSFERMVFSGIELYRQYNQEESGKGAFEAVQK